MDYTNLGNSDLKISQLGFGCCPMGKHGWGTVETEELIRSVRDAVENGVNFFDTADIYGFGESEQILGKALKGSRNKVIIATKFGLRKGPNGKIFYDISPEWIDTALDESLKRLGVDYVDIYQVHYIDGKAPLEITLDALEKKREEGKLRYYGLSNISCSMIEKINLPGALISFQNEYSLANRSHEDEIKKITENNNLGFLSWGSLGQGILSGKYNENSLFEENDRRRRHAYKNFHSEKLKKNMLVVKEMVKISKHYNKTLTQIAIRWILDFLGFGVVLTGIKSQAQISQNIGAFGWRLGQEEVDLLDKVSAPGSVY